MNKLTIKACPLCGGTHLERALTCVDHYASGEMFHLCLSLIHICTQYGIGNVAHTGLQRQEVVRRLGIISINTAIEADKMCIRDRTNCSILSGQLSDNEQFSKASIH